MNSQFKRGIVELCVMSIMTETDMYGYAIINRLSEFIDVNENTIYPILRRLTKEEYFDTYLVESSEGAPRKYYRMTEKGFAYYMMLRQEWNAFIGGVYQIINEGGKKDEEILRRFTTRTQKEKHE
ncbi:MAG: PadR family transcriptional regulator [Bacilli bacterium]|nr:PadR family transcriptional regulator [Bacilli bacterium]MBN2696711.1 PadR family transcriptional regulator [Bacilli bacterium]